MNTIKLSQLSLNNLAQKSIAVRATVILLISCFIMGLGYELIVKAHFEQLNRLKIQEARLKTDFEFKHYQASNLKKYRNQLQSIEKLFAMLLKQLPIKNEMPGLLEEISNTGLASGLTFELFAPQTEITHDFYIELPIKSIVIGTYGQLAMFLSQVADMNRMVTFNEFNIKRVLSEDKKTGLTNKLMMNITAKIYRYRVQ